MTVSSQTSNETFFGNGVTTIWDLPFRFFNNSDIQASIIDPVAGTITALVQGTDYSLTGAGLPEQFGTAPGKITTAAPVANGKSLYVERVMAVEQLTDIINQGDFFPEIHEDVFDKLTMLIQQGSAVSSRALTMPPGMNYYDAKLRRIVNLAPGVAPNDAVNKSQMEAADAAVAATAAANLATEVAALQGADANLQAQLTGNVPLEASAFSEISWHGQVIQNSVTIPDNKNAWSFGPTMTIGPGAMVTVGDGSFWTIADGVSTDEGPLVAEVPSPLDFGEL